jgi:hypothetical protein
MSIPGTAHPAPSLVNVPVYQLKDKSERLTTLYHTGSYYLLPFAGQRCAERVSYMHEFEQKYSRKKWQHYCRTCRILCNIDSHVCAMCQRGLRQNRCPGNHEHDYIPSDVFLREPVNKIEQDPQMPGADDGVRTY